MDLGVRPQPQMLWGEDFGPETDVDHPEIPPVSRPESSQEDVVDGSSDSDEEEWNYVRGAAKPAEIDKLQNDDEIDMESQLNPNAAEFVPGVTSGDGDEIIASSPNVDNKILHKDLNDIVVPSEIEFDQEASTRPSELEPATDLDIFNSSIELNEKRENEDKPVEDEAKPDGVTLILSSHDAAVNGHADDADDEKVDTNPFSTEEAEEKSTENDEVNFVQDHFGKNELSFKPFEPVTPQNIDEKGSDLAESHIPNSVSAEISSHFNFIDSHLDNSDSSPIHEEMKTGISKDTGMSFGNELNFDDLVKSKTDFSIDNDVFTTGFESATSNNPFEISEEKDTIKDSGLVDEVKDTIKDSGLVDEVKENCGFYFSKQESEPVTENVFSSEKFTEDLNESTEEIKHEANNEDAEIEKTIRTIESEKEHTQLEVKEHESPVMSESFSNDILINNVHQETKPEVESDICESEPHINVTSHPVEKIEHEEVEVKASTVEELIVEASAENVVSDSENVVSYDVEEENLICDSTHNESIVEQYKEEDEPKVVDLKEEELRKEGEELKEIDEPKEEEEQIEVQEVAHEEVSREIIPSELVGDVLHEENEVHADVQNELVSDIPKVEPIYENFEENLCTLSSEENINYVEELVSHNEEPQVELALGPNSFSFSQPYGMEPSEQHSFFSSSILGIPKNDIMTTSMHESLDHDSSFEIIECESTTREAINAVNIPAGNLIDTLESAPEPVSEIVDFKMLEEPLENGISHVESTPEVASPIEEAKIEEAKEVMSEVLVPVAAESQETPACNGTEMVFVEQICPTVEVTSEESSPVDKEDTSLGLAVAAVSAAAIASVAVGAAAAAVAIKDDESPKKEELKAIDPKTTVKLTTTKAPSPNAVKRLGALGVKPTVSKPPAPKAAPAKPTSPISAKPKATLAAKPAASAVAKAKPATPTSKSAASPASKTAPAAKPVVKSTAAPLSKAPAKPTVTSTTRSSVGVTKTAAAKPATTTKTALPATRPAAPAAKPAAPAAARPALTKTTAASKTSLPAKKPGTTTPKPSSAGSTGSRPSSAGKTGLAPKSAAPKTTTTAVKTAVTKTVGSVGAKLPATKSAISAPAAKPKAAAASPTKPAPIKAKAPVAATKKPAPAPAKKTSTTLEKNAKNAVKSVPKKPAQIENGTVENKEQPEPVSSTTHDLHIENGNISPLEELSPQII